MTSKVDKAAEALYNPARVAVSKSKVCVVDDCYLAFGAV